MANVVAVSALLGLGWSLIAVSLMGGRWVDAVAPGWLTAGVVAGIVAGCFTVWTRARRGGAEALGDGLATYYLGIVTYWAAFVVVERARLCLERGGWTDFNLADHLTLIWTFLVYGSLLYGIFLVPLVFLTRHLVWKAYERSLSLSKV